VDRLVASTINPAWLPTAFFNTLAETTGGMVQVVQTDPFTVKINGTQTNNNRDTVDASFIRALEDFRTSYVLRYTVEGVPRAGWHHVAVRVTKPGRTYQVRARRGYVGG
jgi:hypothetical protein